MTIDQKNEYVYSANFILHLERGEIRLVPPIFFFFFFFFDNPFHSFIDERFRISNRFWMPQSAPLD
jgi:hypothetical protein